MEKMETLRSRNPSIVVISWRYLAAARAHREKIDAERIERRIEGRIEGRFEGK
jgi:hypothetical protein